VEGQGEGITLLSWLRKEGLSLTSLIEELSLRLRLSINSLVSPH